MKTNINTASSLPASIKSSLDKAQQFLDDDRPEDAISVASGILDEDPNNKYALFIMCNAFHNLKKPGLSIIAGQVCVSMMDSPAAWNNLARAYVQAAEFEMARNCLNQALSHDRNYYPAVINMAVACQHNCDLEDAMEWALKARKLDPSDFAPTELMGFINLMNHRWTPGWKQYTVGMGHYEDRQVRFEKLPDWDGTKGQTVLLYSEQGVGDEICFTQYVPEMMEDCNLVIETCQTMYQLFKDSFDCPVYPTHFNQYVEWYYDHKFDAKLSFSQGMALYRGKNEQFTGKPHLKANEEKRRWWRAILSTYPKKKIGISWNAGIVQTGKKHRSIDPLDMLPIFQQDATFVCLEYKDCEDDLKRLREAGVEILDFSSFINGHKNYQDTAALVAELDHVIAPTTAVVDLCGALGKSCDVFVPQRPFWRYVGTNVWYDSVRWIPQKGSWKDTIEQYRRDNVAVQKEGT